MLYVYIYIHKTYIYIYIYIYTCILHFEEGTTSRPLHDDPRAESARSSIINYSNNDYSNNNSYHYYCYYNLVS